MENNLYHLDSLIQLTCCCVPFMVYVVAITYCVHSNGHIKYKQIDRQAMHSKVYKCAKSFSLSFIKVDN